MKENNIIYKRMYGFFLNFHFLYFQNLVNKIIESNAKKLFVHQILEILSVDRKMIFFRTKFCKKSEKSPNVTIIPLSQLSQDIAAKLTKLYF